MHLDWYSVNRIKYQKILNSLEDTRKLPSKIQTGKW